MNLKNFLATENTEITERVCRVSLCALCSLWQIEFGMKL
jgi:hypothetical protein